VVGLPHPYGVDFISRLTNDENLGLIVGPGDSELILQKARQEKEAWKHVNLYKIIEQEGTAYFEQMTI
jgi:hypothetical protein